MYLKVDNVEFGPFACWSVHAPQISVFLQHLKKRDAEHKGKPLVKTEVPLKSY